MVISAGVASSKARFYDRKKGSLEPMVNLVQSNWNILVEDFYRVRGIISILYPTNYVPGLSRTNDYFAKMKNKNYGIYGIINMKSITNHTNIGKL